MLHMDVGLGICIWWKTKALGLSGLERNWAYTFGGL